MTRHLSWLLACLLLAPALPFAGEWERAYPRSKLSHEEPRFERRINALYSKGIQPLLTPEERHAVASVRFRFPLIGEVAQDPTDFYSGSRDGHPFVALPVLSLLFLEDLATAYAWLWANDYSLETIDEYIVMLRYRPPKAFPNGHYPAPLRALHIPDNALDDHQVDDLSLRFRNTAYAFILLHELGHVFYGHKGYGDISTAKARRRENDADRFALDVLRRGSTIPMGAILYFQAQAYFMPNKGQLTAEGRIKSEADWEAYLNTKLTHPLTADRLEAMALHLSTSARMTPTASERETLRHISTRLYHVAEILKDSDLQACMAVVADRADPASLSPRRARDKPGAPFERWCQNKH